MIGDVSLFFGADSIPDDYGKDFVPIPDDGLTEDDIDIRESDSESNPDAISSSVKPSSGIGTKSFP